MKTKAIVLTILLLVIFNIVTISQTVTDYEGNEYPTVIIGEQEWMAENLRTQHFSNGDQISEITDNSTWSSTITPAMCYYENDSITYDEIYGALYNAYVAVDSRNPCPAGWHVASHEDWNQMTYFLDNTVDTEISSGYTGTTIGSSLKSDDHNIWYWSSSSYVNFNSSGFTAVAGGARTSSDGAFTGINYWGDYWTSTDLGSGAHIRYLYAEDNGIGVDSRNSQNAYSIRCVREAPTYNNTINLNKNFKIYPNPSNGEVNISFGEIKNPTLRVFTADGKLVYQEKDINCASYSFEFTNKPAVYFVEIASENRKERYKLIKL